MFGILSCPIWRCTGHLPHLNLMRTRYISTFVLSTTAMMRTRYTSTFVMSTTAMMRTRYTSTFVMSTTAMQVNVCHHIVSICRWNSSRKSWRNMKRWVYTLHHVISSHGHAPHHTLFMDAEQTENLMMERLMCYYRFAMAISRCDFFFSQESCSVIIWKDY